MSAHLFVNTKSRRGQDGFEPAVAELKRLGVDVSEATRFREIPDMLNGIRRSIRAGCPLIILGGGDGTFSSAVHLLANRPVTLGVLPLGTGNSFARDLDIPPDIPTACQVIAEGHQVAVDMGRLNDDYFINVATIGLTTRIASHLTNPMKRKFGQFVYVFALTQAMREVQPFRATLRTENGETTFETLQVVIGNGKYHAGPFRLSETSSITDGKLSLYALQAKSKGALIRMAFHLHAGTQGSLDEVHAEETSGGTLIAEPVRKVTVDGEINQKTPIDFRIQPETIRVIVPKNFID
jgi:YegS/Rv2252/BmrU family lipid kinase